MLVNRTIMTVMGRFISRPSQPGVLATDNDDSFSILCSNVALRLFRFAKNKKPAQKKFCCRFHHSLSDALGDHVGRSVHRVNKTTGAEQFLLIASFVALPVYLRAYAGRACPVPCHDHQESRCNTLALCRLRHPLPALIRAAAPFVSFVVSHQTQAPLPRHADCSKTQRDP